MTLNDVFNVKTARFIAITVVLGAIGSGAWEWILKPTLTTASEFGLNIATLGIRNFKDSLYKDIALGFHEEPSLRLYIAVFSLVPSFILGAITGLLSSRKSANKNGESKTFDKIMEKIMRPALIIVIFLLVFSMVQANQMAYISRAITHFQVLTRITSPYISEDQRLLYQSRFSQVSSKDDYVKLVNELIEICKSKNLKSPKFTIW